MEEEAKSLYAPLKYIRAGDAVQGKAWLNEKNIRGWTETARSISSVFEA